MGIDNNFRLILLKLFSLVIRTKECGIALIILIIISTYIGLDKTHRKSSFTDSSVTVQEEGRIIMSRNYPIWHKVQACHYKKSKSYGGRDNSKEIIFIGTSSTYSYEHCRILTTRRLIKHPKYGKCWKFKTSMDNKVLKESIVSYKTKELISQKSKLNKIKSL